MSGKNVKDKKVKQFTEIINYDKNKWIYVPNYYADHRYILGTKGDKPLIAVGINPSTAQPDNLDNTLKSVERISIANGFDSFIMFNVYPQRATDPNEMHEDMDEDLHMENIVQFERVLSKMEAYPQIWAAWGTLIDKRPYLRNCLSDMIRLCEKYGARWKKAGKVSKDGHPHHPLYLSKDSHLEDFDVSIYL